MLHIPSLSSLSLPTSIFFKNRKERKQNNKPNKNKNKNQVRFEFSLRARCGRPWVHALSPHKCHVLVCDSILSGYVGPFLLREFSTPAEGTLHSVGQLRAAMSWKSM